MKHEWKDARGLIWKNNYSRALERAAATVVFAIIMQRMEKERECISMRKSVCLVIIILKLRPDKRMSYANFKFRLFLSLPTNIAIDEEDHNRLLKEAIHVRNRNERQREGLNVNEMYKEIQILY